MLFFFNWIRHQPKPTEKYIYTQCRLSVQDGKTELANLTINIPPQYPMKQPKE